MKITENRKNRVELFNDMVSVGVKPETAFLAVRQLNDQEVLWVLEEYFDGEQQHNYMNPLLNRKVVRKYESGMSMPQISDELGVSMSTIGKWIQDAGAKRILVTAICPVCGAEFEKDLATRLYCSPKCSQKANKYTYYTRKRGARSEQVTCREITPLGLYKRDGGICHICGLPCNLDDYVERDGAFIAGDSYPSVDHVIPLSKGGTHSWENVRLAHRHCNTMKGARLDYGQEEVEESN